MIFEIGQCRIDIDIYKTNRFYECAQPISMGCSCNGCRNYEAAVSNLPSQITDLFTKLGIDMRKACEIYVNCKNHDGTLLYGGFYHLCGSILACENAWVRTSSTARYWDNNLAYEIVNGFRISFQSECNMLKNNFPEPAIQLDISANIPWVLPEKNTYI